MKGMKINLLLAMLLLCFIACGDRGRNQISLKSPRHGNIWVVAHRGSHLSIPENTLAAYQKAIEEGADFVEIDVRMTADDHLVSFHNSSVLIEPSGEHRKIADMTLQQLQALDIASRVNPRWKDERIPELEDILRLCQGRIGIYLDLKQAPVDSVVRLIQRWQMTGDVLWYADNDELRRVRELCPECLIMPDPGPEKNLAEVLQLFHPVVVATTWKQFSASFAEQCHRSGAKVIMDDENPDCWPQALAWGCDGIQTDHPAQLIAMLRQRK